MDIVIPIRFEEGSYPTSNVTTKEYPDWVAGSYDEGDTVVYDDRLVYRSVADGNTDNPSSPSDPTTPLWVLLGYSNPYRMFTEGVDSITTQDVDTPLEITLDFGENIETIGLLNMKGESVTVTMTDPTEGVVYTSTITLTDISVEDWWEYFFSPYKLQTDAVFQKLPPYNNATVTITITPVTGGQASLGRLVAGVSYEIGTTDYGSSVGRRRYRDLTRDGFGNLVIRPLRYVKRGNFEVTLDNTRIDTVQRYFDEVQDVPTLFVGVKNIPGMSSSTTIFGIAKDFDLNIEYFEKSTYSLEIEGY